MTTAKLENGELRVNGRLVSFPRRIESVSKNGCRLVGLASGVPFEVMGGREAGGSRSDWFVTWEHLGSGYIAVESAVEAFNLIENA